VATHRATRVAWGGPAPDRAAFVSATISLDFVQRDNHAALMRLATRVFFLLGRVFGGVSNQFHYCAAATLSVEDMKDGVRSEWEGFNLTEDEIGEGLLPWEEDLVDRFVKPGDAVLVIGSGSGRDVIPLAERGCHVTCIEPASQPFEIACRVLRERQLPVTMVEGFFEDVPLSGDFAVVMFSHYCYGYIPDSRRRIDALRKAGRHLSTGGRILLNYGTVPRLSPLTTWLAKAVGALCGSDWHIEPGDIILRRTSFYFYSHVFTWEEIAAEAAEAGLRVVYRGHDPVLALAAP
jgi:SAM-dependent methyltransferase